MVCQVGIHALLGFFNTVATAIIKVPQKVSDFLTDQINFSLPNRPVSMSNVRRQVVIIV